MLGPAHCGLLSQAPLLPKLRGCFAEFLDNASPAGLGILSLPACVGLRYGPGAGNSGFSRRRLSALRYFHFAPHCCAGLSIPGTRPAAASPHVLPHRGAGIFTCRPSDAPRGLSLGPGSPRGDKLYPGNLGHSAWRIPTSISLLIPAFSLPAPPPPLAGRLRRRRNAPLPVHMRAPRGFGGVFQPRTFSARGLSASGLLRTL